MSQLDTAKEILEKRRAQESNVTLAKTVLEQRKQKESQKGVRDQINEAILSTPAGRAVAEFGAAFGRGATDIADFFITDPVNAALQLSGREERVPGATETLSPATTGNFMQEGLAKDIVRTSGELIPAAATAGGALRTAARAIPATAETTGTIGQAVTRQLGATTPIQDVAAAGLSGAGAEIGEEVGGEKGRLVGAIAAPIAPSIAKTTASNLIKTIVRGSNKNIKGINKTISDFLEVGEVPTVAQATGREGQQAVENIAGRVAGGGRILKKSQRLSASIKNRVQQISDDISTAEGAESAGLALKKGITGKGGFVDRFLSKSSDLWKKSDSFIQDDASVSVNNIKNKLDELVREGQIGQVLDNPKLAQIKTILADVDTLDYKTLRDLRSSIGQKLGNRELITDIPRAELKQVYGAITEDIKEAAGGVGSEGLRAFNRANTFTRVGHNRLDDFVGRIAKKVEVDKIFNAVTKGGEGTRVINAFKRSLSGEEWDIVASNVIRRLGRSTSGQQNAAGDAFSAGKFLTDWNRLGSAKNALLSGSKKLENYRNSLDKIARVAERSKESAKVAANPSGTGQFVTNASIAGGTAGSAAVGNLPLAASILSTVAMNNVGARLMTNPKFVIWLGQNATRPGNATGAHITSLLKIATESDIDDAAAIHSLIEEIE